MKKRIFLSILAFSIFFSGCDFIFPTDLSTSSSNVNNGNTDSMYTDSGYADSVHTDSGNDGFCDDCGVSVLTTFDIFVMNDLHGKLADTNSQEGVDEFSTYIKNARKTNENTLVLSSGDMWQGSSESNLTKGVIMTEWMNEMDFVSMTLGNHEYDWGEEYIESNAEIAEFPFLALNIFDRATNERAQYCQSSVLVEKGEVKIGIIGAIGDCYSSISGDQNGDIYFKTGTQLTALVKEESQKLRAQGADFIIYSLHDGYGESYTSTATLPDGEFSSYYDVSLSKGYVDLVFEGHTHQNYVLKDSQGIYHLQGGGDNKGVTHAQVSINSANGKNEVKQAEFVSVNRYSSLQDDPIVEDLMDKYEEEIAIAGEVLGQNRSYRSGYALCQLIADLYYQAGVKKWGGQYDIVLGGGFLNARSPYNLKAGTVLYGDVQMIFPFDNQIVLCSIRGYDLKTKFFETTNNRYYISYGNYGASVKANINLNATYYVIVDSYTSTYKWNNLTEIERYDVTTFARDLLAQYIREGGLNK